MLPSLPTMTTTMTLCLCALSGVTIWNTYDLRSLHFCLSPRRALWFRFFSGEVTNLVELDHGVWTPVSTSVSRLCSLHTPCYDSRHSRLNSCTSERCRTCNKQHLREICGRWFIYGLTHTNTTTIMLCVMNKRIQCKPSFDRHAVNAYSNNTYINSYRSTFKFSLRCMLYHHSRCIAASTWAYVMTCIDQAMHAPYIHIRQCICIHRDAMVTN